MKIQSPLWWRKWRARRLCEREFRLTKRGAEICGEDVTEEEWKRIRQMYESEARRRFGIPEGEEL